MGEGVGGVARCVGVVPQDLRGQINGSGQLEGLCTGEVGQPVTKRSKLLLFLCNIQTFTCGTDG